MTRTTGFFNFVARNNADYYSYSDTKALRQRFFAPPPNFLGRVQGEMPTSQFSWLQSCLRLADTYMYVVAENAYFFAQRAV
eukprot:2800688-Pleurochrysis_carterae.AAC.4